MSALNGLKVLVVEDEAITALLIERILVEAGANVIGTPPPRAAFRPRVEPVF